MPLAFPELLKFVHVCVLVGTHVLGVLFSFSPSRHRLWLVVSSVLASGSCISPTRGGVGDVVTQA